MALTRIKAGVVMRPLTLEKIKASENDQFIAILSKDVICVDLIYLNELKATFYFDDFTSNPTLTDQVLSTGAKPRRMYVFPCARYSAQDINQNGKVTRTYGEPLELFYVAVGEYDYKEQFLGIVNDAEAAGCDITSYDLKVHTEKKGEFQILKYSVLSPNRSVWRNLPDGESRVKELLNEFDSKIEMSLAMHVEPRVFLPRWESLHPEFSQVAAYQPPPPPPVAAALPAARAPQAALPVAQQAYAQAPQGYAQAPQGYVQPQQAVAPVQQGYVQPQQGYAQPQAQANHIPTVIDDIPFDFSDDSVMNAIK